MTKLGQLIAVEGIDGIGKSSFIENLIRVRPEWHATREPYNYDEIKKLNKSKFLTPNDKAILFSADRIQHVHNVVMPLLRAGETVVVDRYAWTTYAYQCGSGADIGLFRALHQSCIVPDLVVHIHGDVDAAILRLAKPLPIVGECVIRSAAKWYHRVYLRMFLAKATLRVSSDKLHKDFPSVMEYLNLLEAANQEETVTVEDFRRRILREGQLHSFHGPSGLGMDYSCHSSTNPMLALFLRNHEEGASFVDPITESYT